jgi:hypothetical protein
MAVAALLYQMLYASARKNGDTQKSVVRSSQEARWTALVYHTCIRSGTKRVKF